MTPAQHAAICLNDYQIHISNLTTEKSTPFIPAGTVRWKAEIWNKCDDKLVGDSGWEASLYYAQLAGEEMIKNLRDALEEKGRKAQEAAEKAAEEEDAA